MADLREVFEMTTKQMGDPDLDSWQQQEQRQRRVRRNRKLGAITVVALLIAGVVIAISALAHGGPLGTTPGDGTSPSPASAQVLSVVDAGSGTETSFAAPLGARDFDVSADGTLVAYAGPDENGNDQVFVSGVDGANATNSTQLTHGTGDLQNFGLPGGPLSGLAWSPDSSMIAYQQETTDGPQIFTVHLSDGASTRITSEPQGAVAPGGWTSDGASIVYMTPNYSINHYSA